MIPAGRFIAAAQARGFGLYTGVPCSYLTPFINHVLNHPQLRYVGAANEGDAVAIAAGAELGGLRSVAMFQNSGLGNAVNPLTSLTHVFRLPVLLIVTWRGEPGGAADEPQHELMGAVTPGLLDLMGIPWSLFPAAEDQVEPVLDKAVAYMAAQGRPYALIMRKGSVAASPLEPPASPERVRRAPVTAQARPRARRRRLLTAVQAGLRADDVVIATTGYTGRELYALEDRPCQFYMVGSMGCAAGLGLGLAITRPDRRIIVLDGDGAALMRLGVFATIGAERPPNLVHVVLDNGQHESTGGQATVSPGVDFPALAVASGYRYAMAVSDPDELHGEIGWAAPGVKFLHVPMMPGVSEDLPRPSITPAEVADRLRRHLGPRSGYPSAGMGPRP